VGDYLGEDIPFNLKVMYNFVDSLDFGGLSIVGALRHFLSFFRLPGEAQKVDRMMEKFAEKYCTDNPEEFSGANSCYVLSFSVIMLQTDIHNPQVRNKMTLEDFCKLLRGVDDGQDLDPEYLERIYREIEINPITLKDDDELRARHESMLAAGNVKRKQDLFNKESAQMMERSNEMIKQGKGSEKYALVMDTFSHRYRPCRTSLRSYLDSNASRLQCVS